MLDSLPSPSLMKQEYLALALYRRFFLKVFQESCDTHMVMEVSQPSLLGRPYLVHPIGTHINSLLSSGTVRSITTRRLPSRKPWVPSNHARSRDCQSLPASPERQGFWPPNGPKPSRVYFNSIPFTSYLVWESIPTRKSMCYCNSLIIQAIVVNYQSLGQATT